MVDGRDLDWNDVMADAKPHDCVPLAATDPLYILYTSGTTGIPKGVVRDNGGHVVALKWSMKNVYNVDKGDVYWAASDVGFMLRFSEVVLRFCLRANLWAHPMPVCSGVLYQSTKSR